MLMIKEIKRSLLFSLEFANTEKKNFLQKLWSAYKEVMVYLINLYVLKRVRELCEIAGVQWHTVSPVYTSRSCPECGYQDKLNRNRDVFKCLKCGYSEDADIVGAMNILRRFTEESIVPLPAKPVFIGNKSL